MYAYNRIAARLDRIAGWFNDIILLSKGFGEENEQTWDADTVSDSPRRRTLNSGQQTELVYE